MGGIASCVSEAITFPIDVTKTRIQIESQKNLKYKGVFNCFRIIIKEEGVLALYGGLKPALLRQGIYGTLKLGCYHFLKERLSESLGKKLSTNVLAGMLSGATAMAICNPTDVLKVRMQSNQVQYRNKSVYHAFKYVYKNEGLKGLYRGTITNSQYTSVVTAAELASYDSSKQFLINKLNFIDNTVTHLIASSIAGIFGTLAATPFDVVKSRMMSQHVLINKTNSEIVYKSAFDCFKNTIENEGFLTLYKSVIPSYLRLGPWNIIFFLTYEQLKSLVAT